MPKQPAFPLALYRAWLLSQALSPSTAEAYVKRLRHAFAVFGAEPTAQGVANYDRTLSVKLQENFRAAWRRFQAFAEEQNYTVPASAPTRATPKKAVE